MKKPLRSIVVLVFLAAAALAFADQEAGTAVKAAGTAVKAAASADKTAQTYTMETDHYRIITDTGHDAAYFLGKNAEALFALYQDYFHFDVGRLDHRLNIRHFGKKDAFDAYLKSAAGESRADFVFLRYQSKDKSEMVCYDKEKPDFSVSFSHILFSQYMQAFVENPPVWLREGFAAFFETAYYDTPTGGLSFAENLEWLESAKSLQKDPARALDPLTLLDLKPEALVTKMDTAYPQLWALVSFLVSTDKREYNRFLWDSISSLSPTASLDETTASSVARAVAWIGKDKFKADFQSYLSQRLTFAETVSAAVSLYEAKKYQEAETAFLDAIAMNETDDIPYYYLGLMAYAKKDYSLADYYYKTALQMGGDKGLVNYALGINAYVQDKLDEAKTYLTASKASSPDKFGPKADDILKKLP
jgi:tetratricopeptide (TPR) repeat protein